MKSPLKQTPKACDTKKKMAEKESLGYGAETAQVPQEEPENA